MDEASRKILIRQTFNTVCEHYGQGALRFFQHAAENLPGLLHLKGDEQLLDVATGTGLAACQWAMQLPQGSVTGIDFSEGMLAQARQRMQRMGLGNIEFEQMDMCQMGFEDGSFDIINCSFGLFFVDDMPSLTRHISAKLKPGGQLVTTHFAKGSMSPMQEMLIEQLKDYGVEIPEAAWTRLDDEEKNIALMEEAGLSIQAQQRSQVGYYFSEAEQWWDVVWWAGFRGFVEQIPTSQREAFRHAHLQEIETLKEAEGIPFHVEVIHSVAKKPS